MLRLYILRCFLRSGKLRKCGGKIRNRQVRECRLYAFSGQTVKNRLVQRLEKSSGPRKILGCIRFSRLPRQV